MYLGASDLTPSWPLLIYASAGSVLTWAGAEFSAWRKRQSEATAVSKQDDKEERKSEATVEIAKVQAKAELESKYFAALEKERDDRARENAQLRKSLEDAQRSFRHEIRNVRNALNLTQEVYHQLWNACTMLAMQSNMLRARIKKSEKELFDEAEFPLVDIQVFDPKVLFEHMKNLQSEDSKLLGHATLSAVTDVKLKTP